MILDRILEVKREEIARAKRRFPLERLQEEVSARAIPRAARSFGAALKGAAGIALIAEVKKASPSKGVIRADFDPVDLARIYAAHGASAISVLTDKEFFQGGLEHLVAVRAAVEAPLLRKEFIVDPYQVYEAKWAGADAILLIVAALSPGQLDELQGLAASLGLDALVEVHTEAELRVALDCGATIVGINNRDLRTFHTTLDVSRRLVPLIPAGVTIVSESGIESREDLKRLHEMGVDAVLVGEALAKEDDVGAKVRALLGRDVA